MNKIILFLFTKFELFCPLPVTTTKPCVVNLYQRRGLSLYIIRQIKSLHCGSEWDWAIVFSSQTNYPILLCRKNTIRHKTLSWKAQNRTAHNFKSISMRKPCKSYRPNSYLLKVFIFWVSHPLLVWLLLGLMDPTNQTTYLAWYTF